jgi:DNA polymerase I-like protein with 3'-5' exonuclease and polymerase domains
MDDCQNTYKLFKYFQKSLNDQDTALWKVYTELSIPFMKVLVGMEYRGIRLDLEYLKDMENKVEDKLVEL